MNYPSSLTTLNSVSARMPPSAIGLRSVALLTAVLLLKFRMTLGDEYDLLGLVVMCV